MFTLKTIPVLIAMALVIAIASSPAIDAAPGKTPTSSPKVMEQSNFDRLNTHLVYNINRLRPSFSDEDSDDEDGDDWGEDDDGTPSPATIASRKSSTPKSPAWSSKKLERKDHEYLHGSNIVKKRQAELVKNQAKKASDTMATSLAMTESSDGNDVPVGSDLTMSSSLDNSVSPGHIPTPPPMENMASPQRRIRSTSHIETPPPSLVLPSSQVDGSRKRSSTSIPSASFKPDPSHLVSGATKLRKTPPRQVSPSSQRKGSHISNILDSEHVNTMLAKHTGTAVDTKNDNNPDWEHISPYA